MPLMQPDEGITDVIMRVFCVCKMNWAAAPWVALYASSLQRVGTKPGLWTMDWTMD